MLYFGKNVLHNFSVPKLSVIVVDIQLNNLQPIDVFKPVLYIFLCHAVLKKCAWTIKRMTEIYDNRQQQEKQVF